MGAELRPHLEDVLIGVLPVSVGGQKAIEIGDLLLEVTQSDLHGLAFSFVLREADQGEQPQGPHFLENLVEIAPGAIIDDDHFVEVPLVEPFQKGHDEFGRLIYRHNEGDFHGDMIV